MIPGSSAALAGRASARVRSDGASGFLGIRANAAGELSGGCDSGVMRLPQPDTAGLPDALALLDGLPSLARRRLLCTYAALSDGSRRFDEPAGSLSSDSQ
jgi:hypothetical protein